MFLLLLGCSSCFVICTCYRHNQINLHTVRDKRIIISVSKKIVLFGAVSLEVVHKKRAAAVGEVCFFEQENFVSPRLRIESGLLLSV
jgi:hypothetical protein